MPNELKLCRDRLIELMLNAPQIPCIKGGQATGKRYQTFQNIADHLLANGVIVPPCKVGDTLYRKYWSGGFVKCTVSMITQKADKSLKIRLSDNGSVSDYTEDDFGKTVFLTKEEAEKALKGREGNG